MESKYNLKPCPFCGAPAHMWKTNYCVYIECKEYNAADHKIEVSGRTEEEAAEAWNRRTIEPLLTDDDKETIRIHLGAFKEKLWNRGMWKEAQVYEGIIDRLMQIPTAHEGES